MSVGAHFHQRGEGIDDVSQLTRRELSEGMLIMRQSESEGREKKKLIGAREMLQKRPPYVNRLSMLLGVFFFLSTL